MTEANERRGNGSPRDVVVAALEGEETSRIPCGPLAVHFCAADVGVSLRQYTLDARILADCVLRYYERYRPDAVWLSADTWVTAQAMGASVAFPGHGQPMAGTGEPAVRSRADIDRIPTPDPSSQGRMPLMQEALRMITEAIGAEAFIVACFDQSPFSLACALMGMKELMIELNEDLPLVEALLERCIEYSVAYGSALASCGADMLSTGDSPAGLVGPDWYRELVLPAERRVFTRLRMESEGFLSLHICGDTRRILSDMATSGADVLEIDHQVDMDLACRTIYDDIAIWGNIDPVDVLARGDVETVERAANDVLATVREYGRRRFVLSSGCTLAIETPSQNLEALLRTVRAGVDVT